MKLVVLKEKQLKNKWSEKYLQITFNKKTGQYTVREKVIMLEQKPKYFIIKKTYLKDKSVRIFNNEYEKYVTSQELWGAK